MSTNGRIGLDELNCSQSTAGPSGKNSIENLFAGHSQELKKNEYVADISKMTKPQLLELLDRQNKLINSPLLKKLQDKGEKVQRIKQQIEEELLKRKKSEDVCDVFTQLSIKENDVEKLEWGESEVPTSKMAEPDPLEDDEKNPLAMIASHSGTLNNQRKVKVEVPEEPLITLADVEEAYAVELCNKMDQKASKERFLPHKTLGKQISNMKQRDWSAATPPLPVYGNAKLLTLDESIKIQFAQTQHLKEVQLRHATSRLKEKRYMIGSLLPDQNTLSDYRETRSQVYNDEGSETEEEEDND